MENTSTPDLTPFQSWSPYDEALSNTLEQLYESKVPSALIDNGKYEVCFTTNTQRNVKTGYKRKLLRLDNFCRALSESSRGTWFWCSDDGVKYIPYTTDIASILENAFQNNMFDPIRVDVGGGRFALLHPDGQNMRQYR